MRTALAILGAVVLVPLALGFVGGFAAGCVARELLDASERWLKALAAVRVRRVPKTLHVELRADTADFDRAFERLLRRNQRGIATKLGRPS